VVDGTKCDRSADAPAKAVKKISSATWVITWTVCCKATAAVARSAPSPDFCRNLVLSARPPTPAGVVVAANVLATCMIVRFLKLTMPSAQAHSAAAAPTYVNADTARPSNAHHQFAVLSSEKNAGTVLMNG